MNSQCYQEVKVPYKCKVCGHPGLASCDQDALDVDPDIITRWTKLLTCNWCSDFIILRRKLVEGVKKVCESLISIRYTTKGARLVEDESKVREALTTKTQRLAAVLCEHRHKATVWEPEFVNLLMDKPDEVLNIVNQYARMLK